MGHDTQTGLDATAKDVMTEDLLTVRPDWPIEQLADFLVRSQIHGAPVTSAEGDLLGVVSLTDIARASTLSDADLSGQDRHEYYSGLLDDRFPYPVAPAPEHGQVKVQEIMTPVVIEVDESTGVRDIAEQMVESRVHRLFVTRRGKLAGIVSALDLLKVIRSL